MTSTAFFRADGEHLVPLRRATSGWGGADGPGQVRGADRRQENAARKATWFPAAGDGVGVSAGSRVEDDGIALGTVTMFDRHGALGTVAIATLANGAQAVKP